MLNNWSIFLCTLLKTLAIFSIISTIIILSFREMLKPKVNLKSSSHAGAPRRESSIPLFVESVTNPCSNIAKWATPSSSRYGYGRNNWLTVTPYMATIYRQVPSENHLYSANAHHKPVQHRMGIEPGTSWTRSNRPAYGHSGYPTKPLHTLSYIRKQAIHVNTHIFPS